MRRCVHPLLMGLLSFDILLEFLTLSRIMLDLLDTCSTLGTQSRLVVGFFKMHMSNWAPFPSLWGCEAPLSQHVYFFWLAPPPPSLKEHNTILREQVTWMQNLMEIMILLSKLI